MLLLWALVQCGGSRHGNHEHHGEHRDTAHHKAVRASGAAHPNGLHTDPHGEEGHGNAGHSIPGNYGRDMAVTAASREKGIQLSPKALRTAGIISAPLGRFRTPAGQYRLPADAVIRYEEHTAVYLLRNGWFTLSPASAGRDTGREILVSVPGASGTDRIVIKNAALVRLAHLEAFGASGHGHGH